MTTKDTVRVGVVGTSWWADAMYLPALKNHPNANVTAVCGRNPERTEEFARAWNIPNHFTDYNTMIDSGLIDAIIISSANNTHYPVTMKALDAGLHVLCEKPLALDIGQAKEMTEKAEASGKKCMVPFTYRFMPTARYLKRLIDDGYLGKPYHLNMRYYTGFAREGQYMWRFDMEESGSGVIGDLGSHWLYLAMWFYGEIEAVTCMLGYNVPREPRPDGQPYEVGDDVATVLLEFKNGAQGVVMVSSVCYEDTPFGQTHHMEFHGSDGTLYNYTDWDTVQQVRGAKVGEGVPVELPIPDDIWDVARRDTVHNTYKDIFRENNFMARGLISAIVDNTEPEPTFREAYIVQQLITACQLSAKEGRRVTVAEIE